MFLYYTEKGSSGERPANHLYRYELSSDGAKLENPTLLLNLPANSPDPQGESNHDGGKIVIGPDQNVYTVIGDVGGHRGQAQNNREVQVDGTSGILRVTENGKLFHLTRREVVIRPEYTMHMESVIVLDWTLIP